jgi:hypothetical protein
MRKYTSLFQHKVYIKYLQTVYIISDIIKGRTKYIKLNEKPGLGV